MEVRLNNKNFITYCITKGNLTKENYAKESLRTLETIEKTTESLVTMVQIREKKLPSKLLLDLSEQAVRIVKDTETKILINERVDVAITANADGVHLTSNSIPTKIIRKIAPKKFILGVSTHSKKEAVKAKNSDADFVTFSPIFPTTSKLEMADPKGLKELREVCETLDSFPVLALGGINIENYQQALNYGAKGFAAISFFNEIRNLQRLLL